MYMYIFIAYVNWKIFRLLNFIFIFRAYQQKLTQQKLFDV